jgi:toxin YoeB
MKLIWDEEAWDDYVGWQSEDKKTLKKINRLIKDIMGTPYTGLGKPEPLKYELSGYWSRRIDDCNRLVYKVENNELRIAQCKTHYDK